ncbi:MAG: dihydroorotase [Bacteroidetes bacterium]|nr:dihydroorotase [Bacteroidota bacterium]
MSKHLLLRNARIINEGSDFKGHIYIIQPYIEYIFNESEQIPESILNLCEIIDVNDRIVIPGVIDDQVHFREPGLTHKGDIFSESAAAAAGGITSFMEMPNTNPQTTSQKALEEKFKIGSDKSFCNYSFYIGATNNNLEELKATDIKNVCGIKIFMGSSTGNMLVDNSDSLVKIFSSITNFPITVHCEEESIIQANTKAAIEKFGENIPIEYHPIIRNSEACFTSSKKAVELAKKYDTRLHILHLSTAKEMSLLDNSPLSENKRITAEVCVHHLWFSSDDYKTKGSLIKWNPAIKGISDREELWTALLSNKIDVIATDHAPHTFEEKQNIYTKCPSGGPLVQHSLPLMLENYKNGKISLTKVVEKMCHNPAICFNVKNRGFIKKGYFADLVIVDLSKQWIVDKKNILYKCGWSPFENQLFSSTVDYTIINGRIVYSNGILNDNYRGMALQFNR